MYFPYRFERDTKLHEFINLEVTKNQESTQNLEEAIKIYGIYKTNGYSRGVSIKISRFNHSCAPNAETVWRTGESDAS